MHSTAPQTAGVLLQHRWNVSTRQNGSEGVRRQSKEQGSKTYISNRNKSREGSHTLFEIESQYNFSGHPRRETIKPLHKF